MKFNRRVLIYLLIVILITFNFEKTDLILLWILIADEIFTANWGDNYIRNTYQMIF